MGAAAATTAEDGSITGVGSLMLLDTASLYYRAFYGMPETVTAPDGTPVNAIRGLLDAIARLVREHGPARLVACLDADWRPAFRTAALPGYKAHRAEPDGSEQTPPGLAVQIPLITQVLIASGIAIAEHDGYEADDVIATLAAAARQPVDVVTGDRDLFQLVDDARQVRVLYTVKGLGRLDRSPRRRWRRKYDIPGDRYADFAVLRGDPSDGLPGVPGIGEKTAAALIRAFGSLDSAQERAGQGPRRVPARHAEEARGRARLPGRRPGGGARRPRTSRCPTTSTARCPPSRRTRSCSPRSAPSSASAPR